MLVGFALMCLFFILNVFLNRFGSLIF